MATRGLSSLSISSGDHGTHRATSLRHTPRVQDPRPFDLPENIDPTFGSFCNSYFELVTAC